jgi:hypothetical protein
MIRYIMLDILISSMSVNGAISIKYRSNEYALKASCGDESPAGGIWESGKGTEE